MSIQKNTKAVKKVNKSTFLIAGTVLALMVVFFIIRSIAGSGERSDLSSQNGDITIVRSEITETAKFIPYKAGNTRMEVIAIKAPDGTIRTALNTCQVCYDSGRGYYVQEGDKLVCQNCGNRFEASQIEVVKGGCNPVPVDSESKTDDGTTITISGDFLRQNKGLFGNWKK